ncbi:hypothetical protein QWY20_08605 [Alkalimonas sp. MEB108]|uniref:Fimbrial assembly family protein n=1 Tax=Alkalimonas cellulosilytica TaxID=3058395 RepID=A0ABU7J4Z6_9GAMM|nr:hypothetical protein [Alkalimonas sp. MEB108]MEE2001512.1 hypothetical protein [Alkalimonas sp. MEB108]
MPETHTATTPAYVLKAPAWLQSQLQYLARDGQRYSWQQGQLQPVQRPVGSVLVLSRHGYDEQHESFQIASRSALKKILQQRDQGRLCYHLIGDLHQGQRRVISFTPKAELADSCRQARLVLPISLLVFASRQPGLHSLAMPDGHFYQFNQTNHEFSSLPANALVATEERALQLLGGHSAVPKYLWAGPGLARLWQFVLRLPASSWLDCSNSRAGNQSLRAWLPFAGLSAVLALMYLYGSTALLSQQLESRQQQLNRLNTEVASVLDARSSLQQAEALVQALSRYQQDNLSGEGLWTLVALAQLNNVNLTLVEGDSEALRLQGHAASATDWLQLLLSTEEVQSADFFAPVRRDTQGREQFSIVLELKPVLALPAEDGVNSSADLSPQAPEEAP